MAKRPKKNRSLVRVSPLSSAAAAPVSQNPGPLRKASPEDATTPPNTSGNMFTRAYDGFAVGAAWLSAIAINQDTILQREGYQDLKLFDALLDDDVVYSAFQQRQLALVARPWVVEPGNPDDPKSVEAADDIRSMLEGVGWDRVCSLMIYGRWYGYAIAEMLYTTKINNGRSKVWLSDIIVPDRKWFAFTNAGELRMREAGVGEGMPVPPNKFWTYRAGATHDFAVYGTGLAHWCYWPVWFKRNVLQFWALYLEKYGQPTAVGYFTPGTSQDDINELLSALSAIGSDSAVALPAPPVDPGTSTPDLKPSLMEASRTGGADSYRQFMEEMNDALTRIILSQTMTSKASAAGIGSQQALVHKDVRDEVVKSDSDALHESFNSTVPQWLTLWNYGPDVEPPTVYRNLDDAEDLTAVAERDGLLDALGWQRTDDSFKETYGEGYERKPAPVMMPGAPPQLDEKGNPIKAPPLPTATVPPFPALPKFSVGDTIPLYIYRRLLNPGDVLAWAKTQGFTNLEAPEDLHVTILYSRTPVDPFAMPTDVWGNDQNGGLTVGEGGPRAVDQLGPKGAVVLRFASQYLSWRNSDLLAAGASSDFPEYVPHITFSYDQSGVDLANVTPYTGELRFGPEMFEQLDTDPLDGMDIPSFSADQLDEIDRLTNALTQASEADFMALADALKERLKSFASAGTAVTADGLRVAMLQAFERLPASVMQGLSARMGLAFVAEHAAEAAGVADELQP